MQGQSSDPLVVHVSLVVGGRVVARESVEVGAPLGLQSAEAGAHALLDGGTVDDLRRLRAAGARSKLRCRECGMPWSTYERDGRLGCPSCWEAFRVRLSRQLPGMHRGKAHLGKVPRSRRAVA